MKKFYKFLGIIAIGAVIMAFTGCDNGGGGGGPQTEVYKGTVGGKTYTLTITDGTSFELTVSSKTSAGTVESDSNGTYTLKPSNSETTFEATVSGADITGMDGTITFSDTTTEEAPISVKPGAPSGDGNLLPAAKGKLTVTGLSKYNDEYITMLTTLNGEQLSGFSSITLVDDIYMMTLVKISGGQAIIPLYFLGEDDTGTRTAIAYEGNDTDIGIDIGIFTQGTLPFNSSYSPYIKLRTFVNFVAGSATAAWWEP
jgi:hypothetical protein